MKSTYPIKVREEAKKLYEEGISEPKIAKMLGIKRSQTINDWRAKYGWKRQKEKDIAVMHSKQEMIDFWEGIGLKAVEHLKDAEFKSATEALKVLEKATQFLKTIDNLFEVAQPEEEVGQLNEEKKTGRKSVLDLLDKIEEQVDEKNDEEDE